jgi:cobalt-zinc-cadmium efflux system membrane fusion protein
MNSPHMISLAALIAALLLAGCGEKEAASGGHDHGATAQAAGHADHGPEGEKLTHFSDKTELYVEFPTLVVGQAATFIAHFTWLADFKPVTQGKLTVVLAGGSAPEERFVADAPAVPGIFKPNVTPKAGGERELTLIVDTPNGSMTHELGPVQVFADAKAAAANHGDHADASGIAFTKEQQWKIDFATVEAVKGTARPSIAATATIKAQPNGEALLAAPAAGVLRPAGSFPRASASGAKRSGAGVCWRRVSVARAIRRRWRPPPARRASGWSRRGANASAWKRCSRTKAIAERRLLEARANERMAEAEANAGAGARKLSWGASGRHRASAHRLLARWPMSRWRPAPSSMRARRLFHVANTGRLWLEARVPESEIGRLGTPSGASFAGRWLRPGLRHRARPQWRSSPSAVSSMRNTRTVPVIFEFANPERACGWGSPPSAQVYAGAASRRC